MHFWLSGNKLLMAQDCANGKPLPPPSSPLLYFLSLSLSLSLSFLFSFLSSFSITWYRFLFRPTSARWRGGWGGAFHFAVLLSLSSRYYNSSVATRTAPLGPVEQLLSVLPLYSFLPPRLFPPSIPPSLLPSSFPPPSPPSFLIHSFSPSDCDLTH